MTDWIFVDTCIWATFFSKPHSPEKTAVDQLIDDDRVLIIGPIVAEVLQGFRRTEEANWVGSRLRAAHYWEPDWDDWQSAAMLGRNLAKNGHTLPLTDLILAAVAMRLDVPVMSIDPHFRLIENLKLISTFDA